MASTISTAPTRRGMFSITAPPSHNGPMPTKQTPCPHSGEPKDARAKQCRECFECMNLLQPFRRCYSCKAWHPADQFALRSDGSRPRASCKEGDAKKAREWRAANPRRHTEVKRSWEKRNPERHARTILRASARRLGLDADSILAHFDAHNGLCDICEQPDSSGMRLAIDHCHEKGSFRGLLCGHCNRGMGHFRDSPALLRKAVSYLESATEKPLLADGPDPGRD